MHVHNCNNIVRCAASVYDKKQPAYEGVNEKLENHKHMLTFSSEEQYWLELLKGPSIIYKEPRSVSYGTNCLMAKGMKIFLVFKR